MTDPRSRYEQATESDDPQVPCVNCGRKIVYEPLGRLGGRWVHGRGGIPLCRPTAATPPPSVDHEYAEKCNCPLCVQVRIEDMG